MEATSSTASSTETYTFELSPNPIRFDPVSQITKVFFDDVNQQVFAVRSGGAMGVVVKGPEPLKTIDFRMEDKGDVMSIKFSPDIKILAIQRCHKSVEFINFKGTLDTVEYSQSCKGKSTKIIGFTWTFVNEIVFVTDHGIELYQVSSEKRSLRLLKTCSLQVQWFAFQPATSLLLLSSGVLGNLLHPFTVKPGVVLRLPKFEVDLPHIPKPPRLCLLERDLTLAVLYGNAAILVLRHQARSLGAEIVLYTMQKEGPPRKTNILRLDTGGRFATNVVDNLVIVHHQSSKTSMLFDIKLPGESDGFVTYHRPIVPPSSIHPFKFRVPIVPNNAETVNCELYSPNWVVFQPNIIIDAKLGCLWFVKLSLQPLVHHFKDKCLLVDFLLQRSNSKPVLLQVCREALSCDGQLGLEQIATIFDKINATHQEFYDPSEMYPHVFSVLEEAGEDKFQFVVAVVVEYIRSLVENRLEVPHYLNEMIINVLVRNGRFYQLHQFLQYHILADSKHLACTLLSLHSLYPPASQLALDMLKRLGSTEEEIVEVLLSQGKVLSAIRFVQANGNVDAMSARKYLDVAKNQCEAAVFYAVYRFFEHRNTQIRGQSSFVKGEHCEQYVKYFESLYGQGEKQNSM